MNPPQPPARRSSPDVRLGGAPPALPPGPRGLRQTVDSRPAGLSLSNRRVVGDIVGILVVTAGLVPALWFSHRIAVLLATVTGVGVFMSLIAAAGLALAGIRFLRGVAGGRENDEPQEDHRPDLERGPTAVLFCKVVNGRDEFVPLLEIRSRASGRLLLRLETATLRGAHLAGVNLRRANLREADLAGADLRGASLQAADLSRACLRGADLTGADLTAADLTRADLTGIRHDATTRWPSYFNLGKHGAVPLPTELAPAGAPEEDPDHRLLSPPS